MASYLLRLLKGTLRLKTSQLFTSYPRNQQLVNSSRGEQAKR